MPPFEIRRKDIRNEGFTGAPLGLVAPPSRPDYTVFYHEAVPPQPQDIEDALRQASEQATRAAAGVAIEHAGKILGTELELVDHQPPRTGRLAGVLNFFLGGKTPIQIPEVAEQKFPIPVPQPKEAGRHHPGAFISTRY